MKFSVLLLYPDYMAEMFGQDTVFTYVDEPIVEDAIKAAQEDVANSSQEDPRPEDFYPLLVLHGWHDDVRP